MSDLKSRWRNGSTVAASAILSDCTTSLYTLAWGPGGGLKHPRCPLVTFGQSKVTENARLRQRTGEVEKGKKGKLKKHDPSGSSIRLPVLPPRDSPKGCPRIKNSEAAPDSLSACV